MIGDKYRDRFDARFYGVRYYNPHDYKYVDEDSTDEEIEEIIESHRRDYYEAWDEYISDFN